MFSGTKYGRPVGNLRMGRRFTAEELQRIAGGEDPEVIVAAVPPSLTREEMYAALFGEEEKQ